jgi:UDP-glucuronate 4-epimerase
MFTRAILAGEPIEVYNQGRMIRDFTYIDDVVEGVRRVVEGLPAAARGWRSRNPRPDLSSAPYRLYNLGNDRPVDLMRFVRILEEELGKKADIRFLPMQPGDVPATRADVRALERDFDFRPRTKIRTGIREFVRWYRDYYRV